MLTQEPLNSRTPAPTAFFKKWLPRTQLHCRLYDRIPTVDILRIIQGIEFSCGGKWVCLGEMTHHSKALMFLLKSNQGLAQSQG